MKTFNIEKIQKYFIYFIMYAIIGWVYEVFLEVVIYKWGFTNRGILFGPYCPVYGFGAIVFLLTINKSIVNKELRKKILMLPIVFLGCMLIATLIELITSYLCEWTIGSWPWQTYVDYKYNFEGRIALSPSIRFGIGGVVFLYVLQPLFEKLTDKISKKTLNIISIILVLLLVIYLLYTFIIKNVI